jgi:hypothetical protein
MSNNRPFKRIPTYIITAALAVSAPACGGDADPESQSDAGMPSFDAAPRPFPASCADIVDDRVAIGSYTVWPIGADEPFDVVCGFTHGRGWTMIGQWIQTTESPRVFGREPCDDPARDCAGSVHPDAVEPGRHMDILVIMPSGDYLLFRNLAPIAQRGLASMATLDRELIASWQNADFSYAGPWRALEPDARLEINGRDVPTDDLDLWIRADGVLLTPPGAADPLLRLLFPTTTSDEPAQVGSANGAARLMYRWAE